MKKLLIVAMLAITMSGCATISEQLENRVSCSVDGKKAFFNSMFSILGITYRVDERDAKIICNKQ